MNKGRLLTAFVVVARLPLHCGTETVATITGRRWQTAQSCFRLHSTATRYGPTTPTGPVDHSPLISALQH